ncbi:MAG: SIMPL domain-containing protein [Rickettsiales bacterium]|jgi:uncharacterized protein YggE|nr:SIMPL domain-containing protein [Rickettsiales bacterium]
MKANWKIICGLVIIFVAAELAFMFKYFEKSDAPRTIAATGQCLTTAPKDRTAITLRVKILDKNAAVSMKKAADKITEITDFLKTQNVKMQTTQFESHEKTEWDRVAQKSVTLGIETTIAIDVSAENIESIEIILDKFAGQENIYSENLRMFTSAEVLKPVVEKCLGEAVENARMRAVAIASGDNKKIGRLISAEYADSPDGGARPANFLRGAKMEAATFDMATGGGLVFKDTDVSVSVSATFEIK